MEKITHRCQVQIDICSSEALTWFDNVLKMLAPHYKWMFNCTNAENKLLPEVYCLDLKGNWFEIYGTCEQTALKLRLIYSVLNRLASRVSKMTTRLCSTKMIGVNETKNFARSVVNTSFVDKKCTRSAALKVDFLWTLGPRIHQEVKDLLSVCTLPTDIGLLTIS